MEEPLVNEPILETGELNLREYLTIIRRRKWVIIVSVLAITALVAGATTFLATPKYQSSAELLQRGTGLERLLLGTDLFQQSANQAQAEREIQTDVELVKAPEVVAAVNAKLKDRLGGRDAAALVEVKPVNKTDILSITATDADAGLAADVANSFADEYIKWQRRVDTEVLAQARYPIEAQLKAIPPEQQESSSYRILTDKLESLKLFETAQTGDLHIVKTASSSRTPVSPKPVQSSVLAFVVSLFTGVGLVFVLEHFDTKIRSTDEVTTNTNKPILGVIPHQSQNKDKLITISKPSGSSAEAYRLLKTNLGYIEPDKEIKTIIVTSPGPFEGKSTTTANLAVTMARTGQRVIILEADLRRPKLSKYLGLDNTVGLTNVITGDFSLPEAMQMIDAKDLAPSHHKNVKKEKRKKEESDPNLEAVSFNGIKPIYCASTGPLPPNPAELVASNKFDSLIAEARANSDMVLIDTPPIGVVSDAANLAAKVDGVIFVIRLAQTTKKSFDLIRDFSQNVPCNILGTVITDVDAPGSNYYRYGGYYGGYYYGRSYYNED